MGDCLGPSYSWYLNISETIKCPKSIRKGHAYFAKIMGRCTSDFRLSYDKKQTKALLTGTLILSVYAVLKDS